MESSRLNGIVEDIKARFAGKIKDVLMEPKKIVKITTEKENLPELAEYLKSKHGFDHVAAVTGTDLSELLQKENALELIYHAESYTVLENIKLMIAVAAKLDRDNPHSPSLTKIWKSADFHERETYEMLGITFDGHPNLKRLLLPEYWMDKPPLRKDYKVPGR